MTEDQARELDIKEGRWNSPLVPTAKRTEAMTDLSQRTMQQAITQGSDEKQWITQGKDDPRVPPMCLANEAQGWIPRDQLFQSGHNTAPAFGGCMCTVIYRSSEAAISGIDPEEGLEDENAQAIAEARPDLYGGSQHS